MPRFTWRKRVGDHWRPHASTRYELNCGEQQDLACVSTVTKGLYSFEVLGWMWSCAEDKSLGIAHRNTVAEGREPFATIEEAKTDALAYIRECRQGKVPARGQGWRGVGGDRGAQGRTDVLY